MKRLWALLVITLALSAQQRKVQFEEASIKPGDPNSLGGTTNTSQGRFSAVNTTLKRLIGRAYHVEPYQIEGGPKWIQSDKFTIAAKLEEEDAKLPKAVLALALQNLLETRFQLQIHRESKTMPCLALVIAKGGSKLHEVERVEAPGAENGGTLTANKISMEDLASILSAVTERPVKDMTGLKPVYEIKLEWDDSENSIFTALQEQLGLKFETTKAPVEVLVIDRAEKPAEN